MSSANISGVAFVTGGARGLGNAVATSFAREGCEAVAIIDILSDDAMEQGRKEVEKHGAKCIAIRCDVTKEEEVENAIGETVKAFGRIDYAANFAGITGAPMHLKDTPASTFEKVLQVNATGVFLCVKHQIIQMSKQDPVTRQNHPFAQRGAIVNCASVNSIMAGPYASAYTASKHAVSGITKAAALEARDKNIRVNSLSPGFIYTDLVDEGMKKNPDPHFAELWAQFEARQGRKALPREIGDATVLLCSFKMSLVNAHNVVCDYGFVINEWAI